eukprot:597390-Pyramimonas_sp.AAC.1
MFKNHRWIVRGGRHERGGGGDGSWKCFFTTETGEGCSASFDSSKALSTHIQRVHRRTGVYVSIVVTNQCPYCGDVSSCHQAADRHVISKRARPDRLTRVRFLGPVVPPATLDCPLR